MRQEVYGKGTTIKQIHQEVAPEVLYLNFWRAFREQVSHQPSPQEVTIRLHHKPGEKAQIDFCDGLCITDPLSGKTTPTELFIGVLPFSSYTFGEFVLDQKLLTFIGVQERMFAFFGGVTPYMVVDNLKSGVYRADLYDPDVNPTYCDYVFLAIMLSRRLDVRHIRRFVVSERHIIRHLFVKVIPERSSVHDLCATTSIRGPLLRSHNEQELVPSFLGPPRHKCECVPIGAWHAYRLFGVRDPERALFDRWCPASPSEQIFGEFGWLQWLPFQGSFRRS